MSDQMEMYDVVDSLDRVIGTATRREIHQKGLLHRSVHILVFNSKGELYLQKRSLNKDENPGYWDTSAAGHVNAGEDYMTSAHRELEEELGIRRTSGDWPLHRLSGNVRRTCPDLHLCFRRDHCDQPPGNHRRALLDFR